MLIGFKVFDEIGAFLAGMQDCFGFLTSQIRVGDRTTPGSLSLAGFYSHKDGGDMLDLFQTRQADWVAPVQLNRDDFSFSELHKT